MAGNGGGTKVIIKAPQKNLLKEIRRHSSVYALLIIPFVYYVIFKYLPIWNGQIAFKDFMPLEGVLGSRWIGFEHFKTFVRSFYFGELLRNTLFYSFGKLLVSVPAAILLAVTIYECLHPILRKIVQTLAYLPHFLSWVIMYGILLVLLAPGDGIVNDVIKFFGGEPVAFLTDTKTFPWIVIISDAWKEMGWSAIIFIAALMAVDPSLYEAAMVEGVTAMQRVWYITLPSIRPVIVMVVLLRLGTILDAGFNQMFMLYSIPVYSVADIIDTWVYRQGLLEFQFGLATAVGIFKGVIGLLTISLSNWLVRRAADSSLF
jgi:putative aldouronate transport system permease protein